MNTSNRLKEDNCEGNRKVNDEINRNKIVSDLSSLVTLILTFMVKAL